MAQTHDLYVDGTGPAYRIEPHVKVVATFAFVLAVVATPRTAVWAFGLHAVVAVAAVAAAGLPPRLVARRVRMGLPFVAFAVLLPIVGSDPRVQVAGASLSEPGLWAAWEILAKATLGLVAAVCLTATTPVAGLLRGLDRLRVPRVLIAIAGFMVRYLVVIGGEASRMRIARVSRGDDPRWLWQARSTAATAGTLFVRSYERGERVHLAMLARGYTGAMPVIHAEPARSGWFPALVLPIAAAAVMVAARVVG